MTLYRSIEMGDDGWALTVPDGWRSLVRYTRLEALPAPWAEHVAAGRVLELEHRKWRVLWPVTGDEEPVNRLDIALGACPDEVPRLQRVELLLLEPRLPLPVPPGRAIRWDLLTRSEADTVLARAVKLTQQRMREAIEAAHTRLTPEAIAELEREAETGSYRGFVEACARHVVAFEHEHDPRWRWPAPSLAAALEVGSPFRHPCTRAFRAPSGRGRI